MKAIQNQIVFRNISFCASNLLVPVGVFNTTAQSGRGSHKETNWATVAKAQRVHEFIIQARTLLRGKGDPSHHSAEKRAAVRMDACLSEQQALGHKGLLLAPWGQIKKIQTQFFIWMHLPIQYLLGVALQKFNK